MNKEKLKLLPFWWQISFKYVKFNKHVDFLVTSMFRYADFGKSYNVDKEPILFYVWLLFTVWSIVLFWLTFAFLDSILIYFLNYMPYEKFFQFFLRLVETTNLTCLLCPDSVTGEFNKNIVSFYYYNHLF